MSASEEAVVADLVCCASCGIAAVDNVTLKLCDDGCDLVKYCSDGCQDNHREQHNEKCKKRKAELHDKQLFTQPDGSHLGECPICFLPMPLHPKKTMFLQCCSKYICKGCDFTKWKRETEQGLEERCPFCRHPIQKSKAAEFGLLMKRVEKNDPLSMLYMGKKRCDEGDYEGAFEYWTKAAALGNAQAHHYLATMYTWGDGVEKDKKKEVYHLEQAAIGGHPIARNKLGYSEWENGSHERAVKHFTIASNLEHHDSLKALMKLYALGKASKDDYAKALRAYQAAVEATKSPQRKEAERYQRG